MTASAHTEPQTPFREGVRLLTEGRTEEAIVLLRGLVADAPDDADALLLLGAAEIDVGDTACGAERLRRAAELSPDRMVTWYNLGLAYQKLGRLPDALACIDRVLAAEPDNPVAHFCRGGLLKSLGRLSEAVNAYERGLVVAPDALEANINIGNIRMEQNAPQDALIRYERVLAVRPDLAVAWNNRGNALKELHRHDEALDSYDKALTLAPDLAEAHNNRANVLNDMAVVFSDGKLVDGLGGIEDNTTNVRRNRALLEAALASCDAALRLTPAYPDALVNRANALLNLNRPEAALADLDAALALAPDKAAAHNNRANVLKELGRIEEALAAIDAALALKPDYAEAWNNRGNLLKTLLRLDEARQSLAQAAMRAPDNASVRWNQALLALLVGDFDAGWALYEWRWKRKAFQKYRRDFPQPRWTGEPLAGRTILIQAEQGFGDVLQFCRYVPMVRALGARVLFEVQAPLKPLMGDLGADLVSLTAEPHPAFDCFVPLMSLPFVFRTRCETIPATVPYLAADPEKVARWRTRLGPHTAPRIGLATAGKPEHSDDANRSIPLSAFVPLFELPCEFHLLHKVLRPADATVVHPRLVRHTDELGDFSDTAALMANLDLIVTVDTSVAHLAGALGLPVWILLPYVPDWRWGLNRSDSPWYPTATLMRQPARGDWKTVLKDLAGRLAARFG